MAAGEAIGCFGLTEPDFGSNPGGMITRAEEQGRRLRAQRRQDVDHERLDRRRRGRLGQDRAAGIRGFLVEKGTKGFTAPEQKGKLSLRASVTSELVLQDVRVPEGTVLPGARASRGRSSA